MEWVSYALASTFGVGTYNSFLEGAKKILPNDIIHKHIYISSILSVAGFISSFILLFYYKNHHKTFVSVYQKHLHSYHVIIPAVILVGYMITNLMALTKGGGIAMVIINLNMFVTIIAGVYLFEDKINIKIILSMIAAIIAISYGALESNKINK